MNRIDQKFTDLKLKRRKAFIAFITAGDPNLDTTADLVIELEKAGVDIVELGVPFSDPLADGPTIQESFARSLAQGTTVKKILNTVTLIRKQSSVPITLMSSYNPIFRFGEEAFIEACAKAGVDGLIIPDLPPEEAQNLRKLATLKNISIIFFVAPTTQDDRILSNTKASSGFIYYVSLTGITGTQQAISAEVVKKIKHIKSFTSKPVCVGFGISTPQQVKEIGGAADGVIVGSAIVKAIEEQRGQKDLIAYVVRYVRKLVEALD